MTHTVASLCAFEQRVADAFEAKQIRGPIHLCSPGQAQPLIDYFAKWVRPGDWVLGTWRSHYHCLLAGMDEDELFAEIVAGRSMFINSAKHRILCSAIVGGILPIAVGLGMGKLRTGESGYVHCFIGDMTSCTGLCSEARRYIYGHNLPVRIICEDNGYSTNAKTDVVWGEGPHTSDVICEYEYERTWPHTSTGVYVQF